MKPPGTGGQALVEGAVVLALATAILAGALRAAISVTHRGTAESVSFQEALRSGRHLPPQDRAVAREAFGQGATLVVERGASAAGGPPIPFRAELAGRSSARVSTRWGSGAPLPGETAPATGAGAAASISVTCDAWHRDTRSGAALSRAVRLLLATGWSR